MNPVLLLDSRSNSSKYDQNAVISMPCYLCLRSMVAFSVFKRNCVELTFAHRDKLYYCQRENLFSCILHVLHCFKFIEICIDYFEALQNAYSIISCAYNLSFI